MSSYKKSGTLVRVDWGDAWGSSGWTSEAIAIKEHAPLAVQTFGTVVKHDEVGIMLATGKDANGVLLGIAFVPNGMIKKVTKLS
jgi:hypothetical protein